MTDWIAVLLAEQQVAEQKDELPGVSVDAPAARQAEERRAEVRAEAATAESDTLLPERTTATELAQMTEAEDWPATAAAEIAAEGQAASQAWAALRWQADAEGRLTGGSGGADLEGTGQAGRQGASAELSAGALWRTMTQADAALSWQAAERQDTVREETGGGGMDAGTLDRLVERDARRYDAGFQLY
jgi:hypothetical protein